MTFLSRRKRPTTHPAAPARLGRKIISASFVWLFYLSSAFAQQVGPGEPITPKFIPAARRPDLQVLGTPPSSGIIQASYQPIGPVPKPKEQPVLEDLTDPLGQQELPGPQRLFRRDSEAQLFERIAADAKKKPGARPAIFPEEPVVSKEPFQARNFPMRVKEVEPGYVCHRRLLFEQPNFERVGYDFGVLQPAICLGVFYYDVATLPYHIYSDLRDRGETSAGKYLPGDQAPLLLPRERLSVTGLVGQAGFMFGAYFLFP